MPALDHCHAKVVHALEKVGWVVNPKPFTLDLPSRQLYADILAERTDEDQREQIIVIEVKCFANPDSEMHDFYVAIGQYLTYRSAIPDQQLDLNVYLAIPTHAYKSVFTEVGQSLVQSQQIKLIVVNLDQEEIEEWLE